MFAFIIVSAFGFEIAFDSATRSYFEAVNKGVRARAVRARVGDAQAWAHGPWASLPPLPAVRPQRLWKDVQKRLNLE